MPENCEKECILVVYGEGEGAWIIGGQRADCGRQNSEMDPMIPAPLVYHTCIISSSWVWVGSLNIRDSHTWLSNVIEGSVVAELKEIQRQRLSSCWPWWSKSSRSELPMERAKWQGNDNNIGENESSQLTVGGKKCGFRPMVTRKWILPIPVSLEEDPKPQMRFQLENTLISA